MGNVDATERYLVFALSNSLRLGTGNSPVDAEKELIRDEALGATADA